MKTIIFIVLQGTQTIMAQMLEDPRSRNYSNLTVSYNNQQGVYNGGGGPGDAREGGMSGGGKGHHYKGPAHGGPGGPNIQPPNNSPMPGMGGGMMNPAMMNVGASPPIGMMPYGMMHSNPYMVRNSEKRIFFIHKSIACSFYFNYSLSLALYLLLVLCKCLCLEVNRFLLLNHLL